MSSFDFPGDNRQAVQGDYPDTEMREGTINFLLGVGLFKMLKDNQGTVSFRAVAKNETNAYVVGFLYR